MRQIIRVLGVILGVGLIFFGVEIMLFPIFGGFKERLNAITMLLIGGLFLHYGITGKILFKKFIK